MKKKDIFFILILQISFNAKSQDTLWYINNTGLLGLGVPQGNFNTVQYKGSNWNLTKDAKNFTGEYQINVGRMLKKTAVSYTAFFESGLRFGYQSGKTKSVTETAHYNELYLGLPVAVGIIKKTNHNVYKHSLGFTLYGNLLKEVRNQSFDEKKWSFFSQPMGMFFLNTQFLVPTKKPSKYFGVGVEISKDIGFHYKTTAIPFVIENMRIGITLLPFCIFSN